MKYCSLISYCDYFGCGLLIQMFSYLHWSLMMWFLQIPRGGFSLSVRYKLQKFLIIFHMEVHMERTVGRLCSHTMNSDTCLKLRFSYILFLFFFLARKSKRGGWGEEGEGERERQIFPSLIHLPNVHKARVKAETRKSVRFPCGWEGP